MNILEYQAKELLAERGVPVPRGALPLSAYEARSVAAELGASVIVKAQIHAGGRGKAGGVKLAANPAEAAALYDELLGKNLITAQTGPSGARVRRVYMEEALPIEREFYLGFVIDRKEGRVAILAAKEGGSEVERNASAACLQRVVVDPALGPTAYALRDLARELGLEGPARKSFFDLVDKLYHSFVELDCSLLEVNPLALLADGSLAIADCKMAIDDSALFRHPGLLKYRDIDETTSEEYEASKYGLSYVRLDGGSIGCMVNGAGLAMATLDAITARGGSSANFLDLGGGADADAARRAFRIILDDSRVDALLVNILGGIVSCDTVATGIEAAIAESQALMVAAGRKMRIVARLAGNHAEEGRSRLMKSGLGPSFSLKFASNMEEAASFAVAASEESERL